MLYLSPGPLQYRPDVGAESGGDARPGHALLVDLQRRAFDYVLHEANPSNGLVKDNSRVGAHASIAAVGLALAGFPVGVERGYVPRAEAAARVRTTLRFFWESEQSPARDATGFRGFYYHFLSMDTGRRAWRSELSTIDTALLLAGALLAAAYFDGAGADEAEIRALATGLYNRTEWDWALNATLDDRPVGLSHGWTPERGFLRFRWEGYNEALILYALALGSPTHPVPADSYDAWAAGHRWKTLYDIEHLYAGPLFIHQLSHSWIDLRGVQDAGMRARGSDYFENSRRATYVHRAYAARNPRGFAGYGPHAWGVTASDGPGRTAGGEAPRSAWAYRARGVPYGPDDGTLSLWAVAASLPFAPEIVLPALAYAAEHVPEAAGRYGFVSAYNPTVPGGWVSTDCFGLDQGPAVLMIENYLTGQPWELMRGCAPLRAGLRRAGFAGGWLDT